MRRQLHCGYMYTSFPVRNDAIGTASWKNNKPYGGFWTSTYIDLAGTPWSDWLRFLQEAHYAHDSVQSNLGYVYTVAEDAEILVLDEEDDLASIIDDYGDTNGAFAWEEIARDYDAFHVTDNGYRYMPGWDCESTVWFNPRFTAVEEVDIDSDYIYGDRDYTFYPKEMYVPA